MNPTSCPDRRHCQKKVFVHARYLVTVRCEVPLSLSISAFGCALYSASGGEHRIGCCTPVGSPPWVYRRGCTRDRDVVPLLVEWVMKMGFWCQRWNVNKNIYKDAAFTTFVFITDKDRIQS